jgi:hypothetical protein
VGPSLGGLDPDWRPCSWCRTTVSRATPPPTSTASHACSAARRRRRHPSQRSASPYSRPWRLRSSRSSAATTSFSTTTRHLGACGSAPGAAELPQGTRVEEADWAVAIQMPLDANAVQGEGALVVRLASSYPVERPQTSNNIRGRRPEKKVIPLTQRGDFEASPEGTAPPADRHTRASLKMGEFAEFPTSAVFLSG